MSDMYEARNSIYCYENSDVLINKLNIKNNEQLEEAERQIVLAKLYDLRQGKLHGNFDKAHLIEIHKYLFSDIYYFAGEIRSENIAKGNFSFADFRYIDSELDRCFNSLKEENYLQNLSKEKLAERLAYYQADLNVIHPFREGNGRTVREFIRELALFNGYELDYTEVDAEDLLNASIKSITDEKKLTEIIFKSLTVAEH